MPKPHRRHRKDRPAKSAAPSEVQSDSTPHQPRHNTQPQPRQSRADDGHRASCHSVAYRQQGITLGHYLLVLCLALASGVANK